jgi:hypothetical protein
MCRAGRTRDDEDPAALTAGGVPMPDHYTQQMIQTLALSGGLFLFCGWLHFATLRPLVRWIEGTTMRPSLHMMVLTAAIGLVHAVEAGVFAAGFFYGREWGLGGFKPEDPQNFADIYYFSIVNYTSLGLGDIYPSGHLRVMAGIEALNGFLLISASAGFIFLAMRSEWQRDS